MHAFIHIGSEKTGSTSLQASLIASSGILMDRGILYPSSVRSSSNTSQWPIALASSLSYPNFADLLSAEGINSFSHAHSFARDIPRLLQSEARQSSANHMIISSEHLSSRIQSHHEVCRFREIIEDAGVGQSTIIFYVRHPLLLAASQVSTIVKSGYYVDFSGDILLSLMQQHQPSKVIELWTDVFGSSNIRVCLYSRDTTSAWNVVDDFLAHCGVDIELKRECDLNSSLTTEAIVLLNECIGHHRLISGIGEKDFLDVTRLAELIASSLTPQQKDYSSYSILGSLATKEAIKYANSQIQDLIDMKVGLTVEDFPELSLSEASNSAQSLWDQTPSQYRKIILTLTSDYISSTV